MFYVCLCLGAKGALCCLLQVCYQTRKAHNVWILLMVG
uniref:Uncharacterized protein n=1 Tax=Anguilla anguilla TaxID=7936 RepID=A0A0E9XWW3_ANGAN